VSRENVENTYRAIDTFNRRDLDAFLALMDPEVEFTPYERVIEGLGPYCGHDGVRTWWAESFEVLPDFRAEIYEVRDLGNSTFVHGCLRGHGAGSGAPFERTMWLTIGWRDDKQVWWHSFQSEAEALKAVGLEE
jgi:ketosteroid isomerase-like protein